MSQPSSADALSAVVTELLGEPLVDTLHVKVAARIIVDQIKRSHHRSHALAQRGGCLINEMRERGLSWREIYDAIGVVQRTADRWQQVYLAEGITTQPADELDTRALGKDQDDQQT